MPGFNPNAAIVGVGYSEIIRNTDRSIASFALEAARDALRETGLSKFDIDGYIGSPGATSVSSIHRDGDDEISCRLVAKTLGLKHLKLCCDTAGLQLGAIPMAIAAVSSGMCEAVLVIRAMHFSPGSRYAESSADEIGGSEQFTLPYGLGPAGARFAQWLTRYMYETGCSREVLAKLVITFRENALLNPFAVWKHKGLSTEEYMSSRFVCEPLCVYDCDMPVNAAGAVIITSAERASDYVERPAYIIGWSSDQGFTESLAHNGLSLADFAAVQLYDGYSSFLLSSLETMGFCGKGEAPDFIKSHDLHWNGDFPVNTFGGNLGEGRLHGMGHVREAVAQVMHIAGQRQVKSLERCLVQVGTPDRYWVMQLNSSRI